MAKLAWPRYTWPTLFFCGKVGCSSWSSDSKGARVNEVPEALGKWYHKVWVLGCNHAHLTTTEISADMVPMCKGSILQSHQRNLRRRLMIYVKLLV